MAKTMTPSNVPITTGQIGKIQDILAAGLRNSGLQSEPTQQVLETQGDSLVAELVSVVRKRVEAVSNFIVRKVPVNRSRTPQEALDATGRKQHTNRKVVDSMPRGGGDEAEVVFFKPKPEEYTRPGWMSDDDLERALALRGLKQAPPDDVAAVNEDDPAFADKHPHGTHWKDAEGNWCFATFLRWRDERSVVVGRNDRVWDVGWWFAGLRK